MSQKEGENTAYHEPDVGKMAAPVTYCTRCPSQRTRKERRTGETHDIRDTLDLVVLVNYTVVASSQRQQGRLVHDALHSDRLLPWTTGGVPTAWFIPRLGLMPPLDLLLRFPRHDLNRFECLLVHQLPESHVVRARDDLQDAVRRRVLVRRGGIEPEERFWVGLAQLAQSGAH